MFNAQLALFGEDLINILVECMFPAHAELISGENYFLMNTYQQPNLTTPNLT